MSYYVLCFANNFVNRSRQSSRCHLTFLFLSVCLIHAFIEKLSHRADGWRRMACELQSLQNSTYGSSYARNVKGILHPHVWLSFFHGTYGLPLCYFWSSTTSIPNRFISFCAPDYCNTNFELGLSWLLINCQIMVILSNHN